MEKTHEFHRWFFCPFSRTWFHTFWYDLVFFASLIIKPPLWVTSKKYQKVFFKIPEIFIKCDTKQPINQKQLNFFTNGNYKLEVELIFSKFACSMLHVEVFSVKNKVALIYIYVHYSRLNGQFVLSVKHFL